MEHISTPLRAAVAGKRMSQIEKREWMYIEDVTRWHEDMNFISEWQNNILQMSAGSE